jgi:hypothetical protein
MERVGSLQIGYNTSFPGLEIHAGHYALLALAENLKPGKDELLPVILEMGSLYRREDAAFLRGIGLSCAAKYLEEVSAVYGKLASTLRGGLTREKLQAAKNLLLRAAELEEKAGEALIAAAENKPCTP